MIEKYQSQEKEIETLETMQKLSQESKKEE